MWDDASFVDVNWDTVLPTNAINGVPNDALHNTNVNTSAKVSRTNMNVPLIPISLNSRIGHSPAMYRGRRRLS